MKKEKKHNNHITPLQRQKFRQWNEAVNKLSEEEKRQEAENWIISALNILNKTNETNKAT